MFSSSLHNYKSILHLTFDNISNMMNDIIKLKKPIREQTLNGEKNFISIIFFINIKIIDSIKEMPNWVNNKIKSFFSLVAITTEKKYISNDIQI